MLPNLKKIIFFLVSFCITNARTQDIHWTQFNDNQLFQNPANAGNFNGDLRFIGNFKDQWRSVTVPFSTFSFSIDKKYEGERSKIDNIPVMEKRFKNITISLVQYF